MRSQFRADLAQRWEGHRRKMQEPTLSENAEPDLSPESPPEPSTGEPAKADAVVPPLPHAKTAVAGIWVGIVSLILVLRLFAVSGWDWRVAASLVDSFSFDDALSVFMGTLFERPHITGFIVLIALPVAIARDYWLARTHSFTSRANNGAVALGLIATLYVLVRTFHVWWTLWATIALTILLIGASLIWQKGVAHTLLSRAGRHTGAIVIAVLVYLSVTVDTPWITKEKIETEVSTYYGYVLESDPGFLKVLTDDREVLILPDPDVVARTILED